MKLLCKDILIVPSHGPLNNPSFPNCILSVFLQNNEVPPFIWTLEYRLCLWLSCYGDTFCSCMLSPFLIVSPAKFGPLEYLPCPVSRLAVSVIHSHGHSAVGFVLSGLTIFTFLPKLCCRPNPCSSPGPIWSTQTQKKKSQPKVKTKEEQVEIFPSRDPEDENWGRRTRHLLVWGWKEILRMMDITHHLTSFPCLKCLARCSFHAKLWDSGTLSEPSGTIWDNMYKIWDDHQNEPD